MSFVRRSHQHGKAKRPKKAAAPNREWVSTVNDLTVHKSTPEELIHRHEIHKSHNKAAAQWELREKALKQKLRHGASPVRLDKASLSIIREVFSDQLLLQDVLARSDRAMSVVKDLFGDAPRRQTGHPSVTMAPNLDPDSMPPVLQRPDPPTQLSLLSQSMMDQQALNELGDSEEDSDEDDCPNYHVSRRCEIQNMKPQNGRVFQQWSARPGSVQQGGSDGDGGPVTPGASSRASEQTALNATLAVRRVRSRRSHAEEEEEEESAVPAPQVLNPEVTPTQSGRISSRSRKTRKWISQSSRLEGSSVSSLGGEQSGLGLLQTMLGQVEAQLDSLSPQAAAESTQSPQGCRTQGLTGFSVALVSALGRLVNLHREKEEEAERETQGRRRLEEELKEQRGLIDALTAETMGLREESAALQARLQQQTAELEQKLDMLVLALGGQVHPACPSECDVVPPAVLLSPPQQRDSRTHSPAHSVGQAVPLHYELPTRDVQSSCGVHTCSSAASLSSLPLISLPSTSSLSLTSDPLSPGSRLSHEAMLAEISQLSRQNELLRAQLSQPKGSGSGVGGSPDSSGGRSGSSSSSTGRVTPQSIGERRMSSSRNTQQIQTAEGGRVTHQTSSQAVRSVSSVEQRLLELNRQNAAARSRLLELIEEQKQSVSAKRSPSVSPVPPSAFSPLPAGGGGTPEVSVSVPSQDGERRSAIGEMLASQSLGGGAGDGKTQVDRQRECEGWFALSKHVR
ncbi:spindle and centriole-associated protein 1 [Genypterus blacodes]|uniref:spindle and centriole-associated protein 1 n=1 Tax=Genypterus blacodes TaxID=154954 RepID=UPI003F76AD56